MKAKLVAALFLSAAVTAQTYQLHEVGRRCGADLSGQLVQTQQGPGIRFGVHSRLDNAVAILAIGSRAPHAVTLPGGHCQLFVDPRATLLGMTDQNGNAHFAFQIPSALPIRILFQAVVVDTTPSGRVAASSDVIGLQGQ